MHDALRPYGARQLFGHETRPAANIQSAFTGPRVECLQQNSTLVRDFRRTVSYLEMAQRFVIELQRVTSAEVKIKHQNEIVLL